MSDDHVPATAAVTLAGLKLRWVEILDDLERHSRTAWLAVFDGRLASLEDGVLVLDFVDATKMAGVHGYERAARPDFLDALAQSIERVTGTSLRVVAERDV